MVVLTFPLLRHKTHKTQVVLDSFVLLCHTHWYLLSSTFNVSRTHRFTTTILSHAPASLPGLVTATFSTEPRVLPWPLPPSTHHQMMVTLCFFFFWWGKTRPHYVALAGLELNEILLILPSECWDQKSEPSCLTLFVRVKSAHTAQKPGPAALRGCPSASVFQGSLSLGLAKHTQALGIYICCSLCLLCCLGTTTAGHLALLRSWHTGNPTVLPKPP